MARSLFLLSCLLAFTSCRHAPSPTPMPDIFREAVGAWHRTSLTELPPSSPPDPVPPAAIQRIRAATYEGPGKLQARIYQLTSPTVASDLAQRWSPSPDTVFFYADRFFVLIRWQTADRKALHEFLTTLQKTFPSLPLSSSPRLSPRLRVSAVNSHLPKSPTPPQFAYNQK